MQEFKSRAKFQFNDVAYKVDEREIDGSDQFPLLAGVVQLVQCSSTGPAKPRLLHSLSLARTRRCLGLNVKRLRPQMNSVLCVHWTPAGWRSLRCHLFLSFFICADMTALMPWKFQARENTVRNCSLLKPAEPHPFTRLAYVENWKNGDYSWHIERPAPSTNPADTLTRWPGKTQALCHICILILASNVQALAATLEGSDGLESARGGQMRPAGPGWGCPTWHVNFQSDKSYCSSRLPVIALSFYDFYVEVKWWIQKEVFTCWSRRPDCEMHSLSSVLKQNRAETRLGASRNRFGVWSHEFLQDAWSGALTLNEWQNLRLETPRWVWHKLHTEG